MNPRTMFGLSREANLMAGTPDQQRQSWRDWRRAKEAQAIRDRWPELPAERLVHTRYWIEDSGTGLLYNEFGGDPGYASNVGAYFLRDGVPIMLEPHDPPSRAELEKRRAAKEQRRLDQEAARKARYDALRKGSRR